ncbi:(-)-alpha-terpineol synthase [Sesamum angolense]|uniref:(-)-alpha-terpineol synthase n=1 Tax=Sesamum angolense TaxID=2727404 RepID=A0AAE1WZ46_9LAMI|nr:(-)-alpha-terpineol synthase [Sesamum angolense]
MNMQCRLYVGREKLGISYHFEDEINQMLGCLYEQKYAGKNNSDSEGKERDLYSTALEFRLLRQHGFSVPQEVFDCFKNEKGEFNPSLAHDTNGLLQLYEASFLSTPGEKTLDLAREFATNFLQKNPNQKIDENLSSLVCHALEFPIHWRAQRPNARWFIDAYERRSDVKSVVLQLAKLDFNIVQAMHQEELKHLSRWWKQTCMAEKLPFARDRLVEAYTWSTGYLPRPEQAYARMMSTKINALTTVLDDTFDVYGTLEELQLFTDAIQRWDMEAIEKLPEYMQICYLAAYNVVNEMAYDVLTQQGFLAIPQLRKSMYAQHIYKRQSGTTEGTIARLADDLATSTDEMKRGDVPKAVECYMYESGASREEAVEYIKSMIGETWKKMNEEAFAANSPFSKDFVRMAADVGRIAQYMYQHGDGHGVQGSHIKDRTSNLLFQPIP